MRSRTPSDLSGLCPRCFTNVELCLCARIPRLETKTRVLILRYFKEAWRTSNTGRLAALALQNARILDYGAPGGLDLRTVEIDRGASLLFPGDGDEPNAARTMPETIVVIDASWRQARHAL